MRISAALLPIILLAAACNGGGDDGINHLGDGPKGSGGSGSGSDGGNGSGSGSGIDAPTGDSSCGAAIQTSAPADVTLSGSVIDDDPTFSGGSSGGLVGATVTAFHNPTQSLGTDTSAGGGGIWMIDATQSVPIDYITVTDSGYTPLRYYPKAPAASTKTLAGVSLLTTGSTAALPGQLGATQSGGNGMVVVIVADCNSTRLSGATVSLSPAGSSTVKYIGGGGSTNSGGVAVIFNAPPGDATVNVTASGLTMRPTPVVVSASYTTMVTVSEK